MKKGIIFDLDGTLWDACGVIAESWNDYIEKFFPEVGVRLTEEKVRGVMGLTMSDISDQLFPMVEEPKKGKLTEGCFAYEVEYMKTKGGIPYPKLMETFEVLAKEYHLYIVSNCQLGYIEDFIAWTGTEKYIEDTENFGNTGREKSYNIRQVVERSHLDAAVYVGDTQGDYESTCQAGLPFIHARYGFGALKDASVPWVDKLEDLPRMVREVLKQD